MVEMGQQTASLRGMVYASMFGAMTAVGAWLIIPFPLVPITLQTLFLNLAAALLGGYLGALSQIIYISLGIIGLPVFAGGKAGFGVLMGPTGGYLAGFIAGAYLMGNWLKKGAPWIPLDRLLHACGSRRHLRLRCGPVDDGCAVVSPEGRRRGRPPATAGRHHQGCGRRLDHLESAGQDKEIKGQRVSNPRGFGNDFG